MLTRIVTMVYKGYEHIHYMNEMNLLHNICTKSLLTPQWYNILKVPNCYGQCSLSNSSTTSMACRQTQIQAYGYNILKVTYCQMDNVLCPTQVLVIHVLVLYSRRLSNFVLIAIFANIDTTPTMQGLQYLSQCGSQVCLLTWARF